MKQAFEGWVKSKVTLHLNVSVRYDAFLPKPSCLTIHLRCHLICLRYLFIRFTATYDAHLLDLHFFCHHFVRNVHEPPASFVCILVSVTGLKKHNLEYFSKLPFYFPFICRIKMYSVLQEPSAQAVCLLFLQ